MQHTREESHAKKLKKQNIIRLTVITFIGND